MELKIRIFAIAFTALLFAPGAQAAGISLGLQGLLPAFGGSAGDYGYGYNGLYLGDSWSHGEHDYTNWSWDTVAMDVAMNGDATITGSMTRGEGSTWGLSIVLSDAQFVGSALSGVSSVSSSLVSDLFTADENGAGLEWASLSMTMAEPYSTTVPLSGWLGLAMPEMGHDNPAELHYVDGEIRFDAWFQHASNSSCDAYCYDVGDSRAVVVRAPIPEPSAALVFGVGLLVTGGAVRRRR